MRQRRSWRKLQKLHLLLTASLALFLGGCSFSKHENVQKELVLSLEELVYSKEQVEKARAISTLYQLVVDDSLYAARLAWAVVHSSKQYDVPPELVAAVVVVESYLDSAAISSARAVGLMQILPRFWKNEFPECGGNLFNPETNICYGARVLSFFVERHNHNLLRALHAYSGGAERYEARVLAVIGALCLIELGGLADSHGLHPLTRIPL